MRNADGWQIRRTNAKTFEEAIGAVCYAGTSRADADEAGKKIVEHGARFAAIGDEASDSEEVDALVIAHGMIAEDKGVHVALFSMFMVGLTVGIEMERAETGKLSQ